MLHETLTIEKNLNLSDLIYELETQLLEIEKLSAEDIDFFDNWIGELEKKLANINPHKN